MRFANVTFRSRQCWPNSDTCSFRICRTGSRPQRTRLVDAADAHGGVAGPMFVIFHGEVSEDSDGPVEVCIPVHAEPRTGGDVLRSEPAHREAYVRITKADVAYPQILSAYQAVEQWIRTQAKTSAGSPREVYFADWDASAPTDEVCDIAFPVA